MHKAHLIYSRRALLHFIYYLRSESVETVIPHMATYEVPLLPSSNEGEDPVRTHTIIPK